MRKLPKSYAEEYLRQEGVLEKYQQKLYQQTGVLLGKTDLTRALGSSTKMMAYNMQQAVLDGGNVHFRRWRIYNKPDKMKKFKPWFKKRKSKK